MRTSYEVLIQSSKGLEFIYSRGFLLLYCGMYVRILVYVLTAITLWHHIILQELYLRKVCTFYFDPVGIAFGKFLVLNWLYV
jgi:hypothetical protein